MKAAIELLTSALNAIKEKAPDEPILKDFEQAIRILEAAEKMNKKKALIFLDVAWSFFLNEVNFEAKIESLYPFGEIRTLIELFPDKESE